MSDLFYYRVRKAWYAKITVNGKRTQRALGKTKTEAKQAYAEFLSRLVMADSAGGKGSLALLIASWLARQEKRLERGEVSEEWLSRRARYLIGFLESHPNIDVGEVTTSVVQDWLDEKKWAANTERDLITVLRQVMKWGVRMQKIDSVPIDGIEMPSSTRSEGCITDDDHRRIMEYVALNKRTRVFRPLLILLRHTGCRPGELFNLRATDVMNSGKSIAFARHKSSKKTGSKNVYPSPCAQTVLKILATKRRNDQTLLLNSENAQWNRNSAQNKFRKIREKLELQKNLTIYSYRHGYITNALTADVPIATVAELVGHASTAMIAKHYGHLANEKEYSQNAAAQAVANETAK